MILESAILDVKPGQEAAFERDFATASTCISSVDGYLSHELPRCLEKPGRYLLLARWRTLEAHTECFRRSPQYLGWKRLLHHYYDPFPTVEHLPWFISSKPDRSPGPSILLVDNPAPPRALTARLPEAGGFALNPVSRLPLSAAGR